MREKGGKRYMHQEDSGQMREESGKVHSVKSLEVHALGQWADERVRWEGAQSLGMLALGGQWTDERERWEGSQSLEMRALGGQWTDERESWEGAQSLEMRALGGQWTDERRRW